MDTTPSSSMFPGGGTEVYVIPPARNGNGAGAPNSEIPKPRRPDMEEEFAASGNADFFSGFINSIYSILESLTDEPSLEVYQRMEATDAEVCKCINLLKMAVTSDGISIAPAIALQTKPEFKEAVQIRDSLVRSFQNMQTPITTVIEEMLDAMIPGHKIAEVQWEYQEDGIDKGKWFFKSLKVKPEGTVGIVCDPYLNIIGYVPTWPTRPHSAEEIAEKIIHPEKFALLTMRMRDENPLGRSFLRAAHTSWRMKQRLWPEFGRYMIQCSIPGLVFIAPQETTSSMAQFEIDSSGAIVKDPVTNRPVRRSRVKQLMEQGIKFRSSSVIAIEYGGDVKQIEVKGEGGVFKTGREMLNEEIEMSLLFNTLATSSSQIQAKSASETHMSVMDLVIAYLRTQVVQMLDGIIKPWVRRNYGPKLLHLAPKISLGDTERRDFATEAKAIAALAISKFLHPSQYPMLDVQLGIEQRDPEQWSAYVKRQQELEDQAAGVGAPAKKVDPEKKGTDTASPNTDPKRAKKPSISAALKEIDPDLAAALDAGEISGIKQLLREVMESLDRREAVVLR